MARRRRSTRGNNGALAVVMIAVAAAAAWWVQRDVGDEPVVDGEPLVIEDAAAEAPQPEAPEDVAAAPVADDTPEADGDADEPAAPAPARGLDAADDATAAVEPSAATRDDDAAPEAVPEGSADAVVAESEDGPDDDESGRFTGHFARRGELDGTIDVDAIRRRLGLDGDDVTQPVTRTRPRADRDELDGELAALRARFERHPTDVDALGELVKTLVARGRPDDAWAFVVDFGEAGGDRRVGRRFVLDLDPLVDARLDALTAVAVRALDRAAPRDRPLNARRDVDTARAFRDVLAPGRDGEPDARAAVDGHAEVAARAEVVTAELLSDDGAVEALATAGAPLPARSGGPPGLDDEEVAERDARAAERGRPIEQRGSRLVVHASDTRTAWAVREVVDAARDAVEDDLDVRGPRSQTLEVVVVADEPTYHTLRVGSSALVPPWRGAFFDAEAARVVVLDPAARGEPRDVLWGHVAREAARSRLVFPDDDARALPAWLVEGVAVGYESAAWLGDGRTSFAGWPRARRSAMALAALDEPPTWMRIDEVLDLDEADERGPTWCWSLVTYLREARDDDGDLLWADRFEALLEAERDAVPSIVPGAAARRFREHVVVPDRPRAGITSLRAFEDAWHAWARAQAAWIRARPEALDALVARAVEAADAHDDERAETLVRRALSADASDVAAHALYASLRLDDGERDAALLALRNVAALQARAGEPLPVARLTDVDAEFAATLAAHDAASRAALETLVADYLGQDFPRAALRVVDRALSAEPLDAGWRATRETILAVLGDALSFERDRLPVVATLEGTLGDKGLWQPDGSELVVRCADRKQPTLLNSVAHLRAPWRVSARVRFMRGPDGRLVDERSNYVGLTFGGETPLSDGHWGLFVSPGGRIELGRRGATLEWLSDPLGHAVRGDDPSILVEVHVGGGRYTVFVDGESLTSRLLGSKPTDGWMSLYARDVDAALSDVVVRRSFSYDPDDVWHSAPRAR